LQKTSLRCFHFATFAFLFATFAVKQFSYRKERKGEDAKVAKIKIMRDKRDKTVPQNGSFPR
jgi:hypothetical protein